jgi:hypothetical protein
MPYPPLYVENMTQVESGTVAVRVMGRPDGGGDQFLERLAASFPTSPPRQPSEVRWSRESIGSVWSKVLDTSFVAQGMSRPRGSDGAIVCVQGEWEDVRVVLGVLDLWFRRVNQDPVDPTGSYVEICLELEPLD